MTPTSQAGLDAAIRVERADHVTDVALVAGPGEVVALAGPNGAGKTTVLRALAGTLGHAGHVRVDGADWTALPSFRRRIGLVHQDHALFPHLSALDNVAYGPRARGVRRGEARARGQALLDRLGVGELAARRPAELSGGQSQRVAVARALATEPRLLLLDEPFAALDVAVAQGLREELAAILADFDGVTLLVTHDAVDLFTLAGRLVVLEDGRVSQDAPVADAAGAPASAHTARLLGRNVLHGTASGTTVRLDDGVQVVVAHPHDGPVIVSFGPSAVTLTSNEPTGSARNRWPVDVRRVVPTGDTLRVHLEPPRIVADLTPAAAEDLGLAPGARVWASVKATDVDVVHAAR